ncbi:MAG: C-type lectin domain-containing protein [Polyangiaceae bacterium]
MLAALHRLVLLGTFTACACATSEDVEEAKKDASSGGGGGAAGSIGGGGFPGVDGGGGIPGTDGGGFPVADGGGGTSCGPEICNGLDDDCDSVVDNGACSSGCSGQSYKSHGYALCSTAKGLSEAAADCIAQSMRVARPNDAEENDWLRQTATAAGFGAFWLGATDWTTEGDWEWPDGLKFWTGGANGSAVGGAYANWAAKQPSGTAANDCMQMNATGQWTEVGCTKTAVYICEEY